MKPQPLPGISLDIFCEGIREPLEDLMYVLLYILGLEYGYIVPDHYRMVRAFFADYKDREYRGPGPQGEMGDTLRGGGGPPEEIHEFAFLPGVLVGQNADGLPPPQGIDHLFDRIVLEYDVRAFRAAHLIQIAVKLLHLLEPRQDVHLVSDHRTGQRA